MAKIHAMMDIGKRSMLNSQTSLQTVAHNIANKSTEGFSRQRVDVVTNTPITEGRLQMGMGARAAQVSRVNNPFVEKQLEKETGVKGYLDGQAEAMSRVEEVFNEQVNKGLNQYISDFFNSFRELSNNPESTTTRTMVKETADAMTRDFARVDKQLSEIQKDVDQQIISGVEEINKMTKEIADLNQQIVSTEMQGVPANDQRDRREVLVKKLHEKIDIKVAEGDRGAITVSTAGNAILVSGLDHMELSTYHDSDRDREQIYYAPTESTPPFQITDRIKGGSLGGAIQVRDKVIDDLKEKMNTLAYGIGQEVNNTHVLGYDRNGREGLAFFEPTFDESNAATKLKLNAAIANDVTRIAAASKPNAPGDATVANVISLLQYREVMDGGTATIDDYYNSQVGRVGVMTHTAMKSREAQGNILQQVSNLRESISGVSLDEEATKMLEFQKAFDASARLIRTADEMFDTVLNLKRL